jgi:hypothetical protein
MQMLESACPVAACRDANAMVQVQPDLYRRIDGDNSADWPGVGHACMHWLLIHVSCMHPLEMVRCWSCMHVYGPSLLG